MTKDEIATDVANRTALSKAQAESAYHALIELIAAELKAGREFQMRDIGTLKVKPMAARIGRNPRTGQEIKIPARKAVKFKASVAIANAINA